MKRLLPVFVLGLCALLAQDSLAQKKKHASKSEPKTELKKVEKKLEPRKHKPTDTVGVINGDVITYSDYRTILADIMRQAARDSIASEADFTKWVDAAWDHSLEAILTRQEITKRELKLTEDEVKAELVNNPPEFLKKQFTDSVGTFYPDALHAALYDPTQQDVVIGIVAAQRLMMEEKSLKLSLAPEARTDEEREKAYQAWLLKAKNNARTIDNRLRFGYY
ncbi:MAG TPA: SurA N-terminal domain-containing protein [Candidatus Kapabacteria bacterium]|nr:SurA N-terminal domain-containing protein [Candidatus Kapabacteria bacterium]